MAIYAIGDVQGCYDQLAKLIDRLHFEPASDELWFVGDLVNRGPRSLDVLRFVRSLGSSAITVLGNHDLHLIAAAHDRRRGAPAVDQSLQPVLAARDRDELIGWLRRQPLALYRPELNTLMVHAGVLPSWDPLQTIKLAREVETVLRSEEASAFLQVMYGARPDRWSPDLSGADRLRFITNCLTRIRFCGPDDSLDFRHKGPPGSQPETLTPWFDVPERATASVRVLFGHWAALGLVQRKNLLGIDTGCVWGRQLTGARLDGPTQLTTVESSFNAES